MRIVIINGPNLNLIGTRSPEIYGTTSLSELEEACRGWATDLGATAETYQSNHEGDIIDRLHSAREADAVIINPGAFTHYSYAIRDAIDAIGTPTVEVHISNIKDREPWRRVSVVSDVCAATIYGRGIRGYRDAINHVISRAAWPMETISYGPDDDHVGDLRIPDGPGPFPVAVLLHGGFWRDVFTRDLLDAAAVDLTRRGWATWNVEFARVGGGGGWRASSADAAAAIASLGSFGVDHGLDLDRVVLVGHGSGGQLALRATRDVEQVGISAVVGLAPIGDLEAAHRAGIGDDAVAAFVRSSPDESPNRYNAASPIRNLPLGVPLLIVHGDEDDRIPAAISRSYAGRAADEGDTVVYHELEGVGHAELIDPAAPAWAKVVEELDRLR
ncbi:MAG: type II 3-dehydroquinate dehydratase [Actinomycetota bacterium]